MSLIDFDQIEMSTGGDLEFAAELVEIYEESVNDEIAGLRGTYAAGDAATFGRHAHTIKGASANMGANVVRAGAYELEKMGKSGDLSGVSDKIVSLEADFKKAIEALKLYASGK